MAEIYLTYRISNEVMRMQATVAGLRETMDSLKNAASHSWAQWNNALKETYGLRLQESQARHQESEQRLLASEAQCNKLLEQIAHQNREAQQKQETQQR